MHLLLIFHPNQQPSSSLFSNVQDAQVNPCHHHPRQPQMPDGLPYPISPLQSFHDIILFTLRHRNPASIAIATWPRPQHFITFLSDKCPQKITPQTVSL